MITMYYIDAESLAFFWTKIPTLNLPEVHMFDSNHTPSLSTRAVKYNCKPNC